MAMYGSTQRFEATPSMRARDLRAVRDDPAVTTVQFTGPLERRDYRLLEKVVFSSRPDLELRMYGWYGLPPIDLGFLRRIPSATRISIDAMRGHDSIFSSEEAGLEVLTERPNLRAVTVGLSGLGDFDFLDGVTENLSELGLHATKSSRPSLRSLSRFGALERLLLERHQRDIDALASLTRLREVVLRSISTLDLGYLSGLPRLETVRILLGGIRDLTALATLESLTTLELWQVSGLSDLSFISDLTSLETLSLQSLARVTRLPPLDTCRRLRRITLETMRGLVDVATLEAAPALAHFHFADASPAQPEMLVPLLRNPSVVSAGAGFGGLKKNARFDALARSHGKAGRDAR